MRGTAWHRVIRLTIRLASSIVVVFLVIDRGAAVTGNSHSNFRKLHPNSNFPETILQGELGRSSRTYWFAGYIGDTSRPVRRLLEDVGECDVTQKGKDDVLQPQESKYVGDVSHLLDLSPESGTEAIIPVDKATEGSACTNAREHPGYTDSCKYVQETPECKSGTLIEYTEVFYCFFSGTPILAYAAGILWLAGLFYVLGHTANNFFCVSMDNLSEILGMSSSLAGVTLLPFGNGAPDVFASIAAFVGHSGQEPVGLNSVVGGALFVSSVVAGSVSLAMIAGGSNVELSRPDFLRDIGFLLFSLAVLTAILFDGEIHLWEALSYISIYAFYVTVVTAVEYLKWRSNPSIPSSPSSPCLMAPLLPGSESGNVAEGHIGETDHTTIISSAVQNSCLQRILESHGGTEGAENGKKITNRTDVSADETSLLSGTLANGNIGRQESLIPLLQLRNEQEVEELKWYSLRGLFSYFVEWPLTLPRRLTIPLIEKVPRWSKFYAVCSATLAPILLAMLWDGKDDGPVGSARVEYVVAGSLGIVLGGLSLIFLKEDWPPRRCNALWAASGFIMSMVWFYVIAMELVAALVALGSVLQIDPAILGLTVLAWGNSLGDMMSNLALASRGDHRMQTAFSGCYAGPMFNSLVGLGVSFVLKSWGTYPAPFAIPEDNSLFITLAFLVIGLVWALIMLLSRDMKPTKVFGVGLLILYITFLTTRLAYALDIQSILVGSPKKEFVVDSLQYAILST